MPYNPGSAYPRKTIYTPPVYGEHSFQRAVNAPDFTPRQIGSGTTSNTGGAILSRAAQASGRVGHASAGPNMAAITREGVAGKLRNRQQQQSGMRQNRPDYSPQRNNPGRPRYSALSQQQHVDAINQNLGGWGDGGGAAPGGSGSPVKPTDPRGGHPGGMHTGSAAQVERMHAEGDAVESAAASVVGSPDQRFVQRSSSEMTAGPDIYVPGESGKQQHRLAQDSFLFTMHNNRQK